MLDAYPSLQKTITRLPVLSSKLRVALDGEAPQEHIAVDDVRSWHLPVDGAGFLGADVNEDRPPGDGIVEFGELHTVNPLASGQEIVVKCHGWMICLRGIFVGSRTDTHDPDEGVAERRFGSVSDQACCGSNRTPLLSQQPGRQMHPPASQVVTRGLADSTTKPRVERRARQSDRFGQLVDRPSVAGAAMHQSERLCDNGILQAS